MNVVFMGTSQFAVPSLMSLITSKHNVVAVITQPDKPAGRGRKLTAPPVKMVAKENNLPVFQPPSIRNESCHQVLKEFSPDVIVVVAYAKILPPEVLDIPKYGCINIHASLLPAYRGAAPIQWALINGEAKTGVTVMWMDTGMDTGDVIRQEEVKILVDDDGVSLTHMLSVMGANSLVKVLDDIEGLGLMPSTAQDETKASYAPILKKQDGRISWAMHVDRVYNLIRGTNPKPGAFTMFNSKRVKILRVSPYDCNINASESEAKESERTGDGAVQPPGEIIAVIKGKGFLVRTGTGGLLVTEIQPENKAPMRASSFIDGGYAIIGSVFE